MFQRNWLNVLNKALGIFFLNLIPSVLFFVDFVAGHKIVILAVLSQLAILWVNRIQIKNPWKLLIVNGVYAALSIFLLLRCWVWWVEYWYQPLPEVLITKELAAAYFIMSLFAVLLTFFVTVLVSFCKRISKGQSNIMTIIFSAYILLFIFSFPVALYMDHGWEWENIQYNGIAPTVAGNGKYVVTMLDDWEEKQEIVVTDKSGKRISEVKEMESVRAIAVSDTFYYILNQEDIGDETKWMIRQYDFSSQLVQSEEFDEEQDIDSLYYRDGYLFLLLKHWDGVDAPDLIEGICANWYIREESFSSGKWEKCGEKVEEKEKCQVGNTVLYNWRDYFLTEPYAAGLSNWELLVTKEIQNQGYDSEECSYYTYQKGKKLYGVVNAKKDCLSGLLKLNAGSFAFCISDGKLQVLKKLPSEHMIFATDKGVIGMRNSKIVQYDYESDQVHVLGEKTRHVSVEGAYLKCFNEDYKATCIRWKS